jgi:hypothetical protein
MINDTKLIFNNWCVPQGWRVWQCEGHHLWSFISLTTSRPEESYKTFVCKTFARTSTTTQTRTRKKIDWWPNSARTKQLQNWHFRNAPSEVRKSSDQAASFWKLALPISAITTMGNFCNLLYGKVLDILRKALKVTVTYHVQVPKENNL